jgi:uncharacterized protein YlxW (UPF0749 family)
MPEDQRAEDQRADDRPRGDGRRGDGSQAEPAEEWTPGHARRPTGRSLLPSRASALIAALCALLGFALVAQVQSTGKSKALPAAREGDLVQILNDLDSRQERLRREIAGLETTNRQLASGTEGSAAALAEAQRRADELGILAGTAPVSGPGLVVTIRQGSARLNADVILDAVQELRGAGAEAMQIGDSAGRQVRIGASTYFVDGTDGVEVDGVAFGSPYTITAIGDPSTMRIALQIAGGVVDTVRSRSASIDLAERDAVDVTALRQLRTPQYARPVS